MLDDVIAQLEQVIRTLPPVTELQCKYYGPKLHKVVIIQRLLDVMSRHSGHPREWPHDYVYTGDAILQSSNVTPTAVNVPAHCHKVALKSHCHDDKSWDSYNDINHIISLSMDMPISGYDGEMQWLHNARAQSIWDGPLGIITLRVDNLLELDDEDTSDLQVLLPDYVGPEDSVIFSACTQF